MGICPYKGLKWLKWPKCVTTGYWGDSEAWKPQKLGGCGWTRCPLNRILSHVAEDPARAWFWGVGAHCANFGAFWRFFGPYLGHIVELSCAAVMCRALQGQAAALPRAPAAQSSSNRLAASLALLHSVSRAWCWAAMGIVTQ